MRFIRWPQPPLKRPSEFFVGACAESLEIRVVHNLGCECQPKVGGHFPDASAKHRSCQVLDSGSMWSCSPSASHCLGCRSPHTLPEARRVERLERPRPCLAPEGSAACAHSGWRYGERATRKVRGSDVGPGGQGALGLSLSS